MTDPVRQSGASIAYEWWRVLNPPEGAPRSGPRRAALARMRRAATPIEVMQEPEALRLIARLPRNPDRSCHACRDPGPCPRVRRSARRPGSWAYDTRRRAVGAPLRKPFRRLLQTPDTALMEPMRRLARMTSGKLNVHDLASAVLYWGEGVKRRWIFDYYGVADIRSGAGRVRERLHRFTN